MLDKPIITARLANRNDIPDIIPLGKAFYDLAGWPKYADWDELSVMSTLVRIVNDKIPGILIVGEVNKSIVGMICCLLFPFYCNLNVIFGQELFWYVQSEFRSSNIAQEMKNLLELEAKSRGAHNFIMGSVSGLRDETLARFYKMQGYEPCENTFIKRL